jgi:hypothetical protein
MYSAGRASDEKHARVRDFASIFEPGACAPFHSPSAHRNFHYLPRPAS